MIPLMAAIDGDGDLVVLLSPVESEGASDWWALWRHKGTIRLGMVPWTLLEILEVHPYNPPGVSPVEFLALAEDWLASNHPEKVKTPGTPRVVKPL